MTRNISALATEETRKRYGNEPKNPPIVGMLVFVAVGVGVPICLVIADALGLIIFNYRLIARGADVMGVFVVLGVAAGIGAFFFAEWRTRKWSEHWTDVYDQLDAADSLKKTPD